MSMSSTLEAHAGAGLLLLRLRLRPGRAGAALPAARVPTSTSWPSFSSPPATSVAVPSLMPSRIATAVGFPSGPSTHDAPRLAAAAPGLALGRLVEHGLLLGREQRADLLARFLPDARGRRPPLLLGDAVEGGELGARLLQDGLELLLLLCR